MKVVVAIDSFKGSMTSMQAGNACKEGILAAARAHCGGGAAAVRDRKPAADNMRCCRKTARGWRRGYSGSVGRGDERNV